jgi:integrase
MSLSEKKIRKLITAGERARVTDSSPNGTRGLYLCVDSKAAASWTFRYQLDGKSHWLGLGPARDFTLSEARVRAREQRQKLADKIDPLTTRRAERLAQATKANAITFRDAAATWHETMSPRWSSAKHAEIVRSRLSKWVVPLIGVRAVAEIETPDVLRVLQQSVKDETFWVAHAVTASRVRNDIEQILSWCGVAGYRSATASNPAKWAGHLALMLPAPRSVTPTQRYAAMRYQDIPALMARLMELESLGAGALQFLILTGARITEVARARWEEIDFNEALWTVPASRMKARREWRQPLAPQVVDLLKSLPTEANNKYLFIGREGAELSSNTIRQTLRREGHGDATVHGFRSAFSDWAHETTAFNAHTIELSLAHQIGSETERAYRRTDLLTKRRELMTAWAGHCLSPPGTQSDTAYQQKAVLIGA